jgi:diadenylate cyclase
MSPATAGTEDLLEYAARVVRTYGGVAVAAELLLIGGAVWVVMRFLRGTRGARLLTGFLLLMLFTHLAVQWVADRWNLARVKLLYERFLLLLTIGSIVIFQPELRRALVRLGEAGLPGSRRREYGELAEELGEAVRGFSRNRIGAIIAIERTVGLGAVVENGVALDAKVTAALLKSIFWPGGALHDMGVVISNGRVAAARCPFPLSDVGTDGGSLGSRHRAALGLTEDTDALVIVVSEETGRISFAERGRLHPLADPDRFRIELLARLGGKRASEAAAPPPGSAAPETGASAAPPSTAEMGDAATAGASDPSAPPASTSTADSAVIRPRARPSAAGGVGEA